MVGEYLDDRETRREGSRAEEEDSRASTDPIDCVTGCRLTGRAAR